MALLLQRNGDVPAAVPTVVVDAFADEMSWANGFYCLTMYDVQVALCEYHRWLTDGGTALRPLPADVFNRMLRENGLTDVPPRVRRGSGEIGAPAAKHARQEGG